MRYAPDARRGFARWYYGAFDKCTEQASGNHDFEMLSEIDEKMWS